MLTGADSANHVIHLKNACEPYRSSLFVLRWGFVRRAFVSHSLHVSSSPPTVRTAHHLAARTTKMDTRALKSPRHRHCCPEAA